MTQTPAVLGDKRAACPCESPSTTACARDSDRRRGQGCGLLTPGSEFCELYPEGVGDLDAPAPMPLPRNHRPATRQPRRAPQITLEWPLLPALQPGARAREAAQGIWGPGARAGWRHAESRDQPGRLPWRMEAAFGNLLELRGEKARRS